MSKLYNELTKPIEHLGATDAVTAADLRNCLGKVADQLGKFYLGESEASAPADVSGSAIGDDGPSLEELEKLTDPEKGNLATITGQDEADTE